MDIIMIGSCLAIESLQPLILAKHPDREVQCFCNPALAIAYAQKNKVRRVYVAADLGKSDPDMVIGLMRKISPLSVCTMLYENGKAIEVV